MEKVLLVQNYGDFKASSLLAAGEPSRRVLACQEVQFIHVPYNPSFIQYVSSNNYGLPRVIFNIFIFTKIIDGR